MATTHRRSQGDPPADAAAPARPPAARPGACCSPTSAPIAGPCWGGLLGFLGGLAGLAQPMVAKLVVDTLGERAPWSARCAAHRSGRRRGAAQRRRHLPAGTRRRERRADRPGGVSRLLRLRVGALDHLKPGDLLSRVTSDTTLLRSVSTYGLVHSVNATFLLVGSAVLMAILDPSCWG